MSAKNYDAIVALSMMIDADPAQISKDALKLKQKVEDRIGSIELQADTSEVKKAFESIAGYAKKFKKSGLNLTQVYDGIFDSFSDPNKSIYEILENLNNVENKLKHLASLKGYQLDMMAEFEPKQLNAVIDKHEDIVNALKKQGELQKEQRFEADKLLGTLKDIDKYQTRNFSKSSAFTGDGRYKKAVSDETVKSLGKTIGLDTSDKTIYQDIQEYSKLVHILTVLNEEKSEYSKEYKLSNQDKHISVLKEEYKIYLELEKVKKRLSSYDGFDSSKLSDNFTKPNQNSFLQILNNYHELALNSEKETVNKLRSILDAYIEEAYKARNVAIQKSQARVQEEFDKRKVTIKTNVVGNEELQKTTGQVQEIGEQVGKVTGEIIELDGALDKVGADDSGLDLWQRSAENLKEEFGDLIKYAISAEEALKEIKSLNSILNKRTLTDQESKDLVGYSHRYMSLGKDLSESEEDSYYEYADDHKKMVGQIDRMTEKQLEEIEKLKVAHKELGKEAENSQGKLKNVAGVSTEDFKELKDVVEQLIPLFTSLGTENLFKGINTEELKGAFNEISKTFGDDLNHTILEFKQELDKTGKADYSAFFDSIRETLLNIVKQFQTSLQGVRFAGSQTNELYRLLEQWNEASGVLLRSGKTDAERSALLNSSTGKTSNSYLYDKEGSFSGKILDELNKLSNGVSGKIGELYDTWLHSHPFRKAIEGLKAIGSDVGFTADDIKVFKNKYLNQDVTKMMVTNNGKFASIDWAGISDKIIDEVIELFKKSNIFDGGKFLGKLATENGIYNFDKQSQLMNDEIIKAMTTVGIADAKSRVKMGNISELNADLSKMQMEEAEVIQKSEELFIILKSISDVLETFNNSTFEIKGINSLITSLGEIKELLSFINNSLKTGISINTMSVGNTLPLAQNIDSDLKSAEKLATQSQEAISSIDKIKDSVNTTAISEKNGLDKLSDSVIDVIEAVDAKTQAFKDEEAVVTSVASNEITNLNKLKDSLVEVTEQIKKKNDAFKENNINLGQDIIENISNKTDSNNTSSNSNKQGSGYQQDKKTDPTSTKHNRELISSYKDLIRRSEEYFSLRERASSGVNGLTSIEKEQLKELEVAWAKATEKVDEYALKTNGSIGSVSDAKKIQEKFISSQEDMYDKYQKNYISDIEKKVKSLNNGNFTDEYKQELSKIDNLITELKNKKLNLIDDSDAIEIQKIKDIIDEIINNSKKGTNILADSEQTYKLQADIFEHLQRNSGMLPQLKAQFKSLGDELASYNGKIPEEKLKEFRIEFQRLRSEMEASGKVGSSFFDKVKNKIVYGWAQIAARYLSFYDFIRYARKIFENVKKYDTALTEMRKVSEETITTLKEFQKESFATADAVGTTAEQLQKSTADWMRLGEVLEDAKESAEVSNILLNVSEFDSIDAATESLVAMSAAYKDLEKIDIVDKLNEVGNNYAISTDGLATALQNSASALVTAGNDIDEAIALTTAGNVVTQDPDKVGTGLRTISLRITGTEAAKKELEELGEDTSDFIVQTTAKSQKAIKAFTKVASNNYQGFDILDENGNFKSTYEIMLGIAKIYEEILATDKKMGTNMANGLLETLAGKNRANIAASILQNPEILEASYESSQKAAGSAQDELDKYLESLDGHISRFKNASDQLINDLVNSDLLKWIIDFATNIVKATDALVKFASPLGTLLGAGAGILGAKGLGFVDIFKNMTIPKITNQSVDAFKIISTIPANANVNWNEWAKTLGYTDKTLLRFLNTTKGSERTFENYQKYINGANKTTGMFAAKLKTVASNVGVMLAITAAVKIATAIWDKFDTTVGEAKSDLEETQGTIKSLKEQIKELEGLDANSLTQGQKDKLENLKEQLKVQEQLEAIEKRRLAREVIGNGNFADRFDKDSFANASAKITENIDIYKTGINGRDVLYQNRKANILDLNDKIENAKTYGYTEKQVEQFKNQLEQHQKIQDETTSTIIGLQEGLISNKSDILAWINTIEGYIADGSLVGDDLTKANENLEKLYSDLEYTNEQISYTNTLLYGGDDSWENVLAEKTQYSLKNLRDQGFKDNELQLLSTLTFDKNATLSELRTILEEAQKKADENPVEPEVNFSKSAMIDKINGMVDGFDVLDEIYADIIDGDKFDFTKLDSKKFEEAFKGLEEEYTKFIETVSESPTDINACQDAFDELASAYINNSGALDILTEENSELAANMLKNMGISNAQAVIDRVLAIEKQKLTYSTGELANTTYAEVYAKYASAEASSVEQVALAQLALEKINVNENKIDTASDIDQILNLAEAAMASTEVLSQLAKAKSVLGEFEETGYKYVTDAQVKEAYALIDSINSGNYDYQFQKINREQFNIASKNSPLYTGGEQSLKAAEDAAKEATDSLVDFFERRVEVLEQAFGNLEAGIQNVLGAKAKNTVLAGQLEILDEETRNYTAAIGMYQEAAEGYLSLIPEAYREAAKNGDISILKINDEQTREAIENYQQWANKVAECTQKLEELKAQIRELELEKFNNIIKDFTDQFDLHGTAIDNIDKQIGLLEEAGELIGSSYYTKQIEQSEKQLALLEQQKLAMVEQLNDSLSSGRIQTGTDEWLEMVNALQEVEGNILDCKTSIEEFNNALLEIQWIVFERIQTEFGNLNSEMENLAGLFNDFNDIEVSDGKGTWTKEAIATLGLYAQQYELARYQANQYGEAIEKLKQDYLEGKYSATEYMDKLAELSQGQWDAINSAESLEDAIISLNETRVNEEIEAYRELIDAQIELIEQTDKLKKKQDELAEKSKTVADIEKQLAAMMYDNSAATVAKRKQLEAQLAEAKKDLSDTEYEYSKDAQIDALNKQFEDQETLLQESLKDRETLLNQSFNTVKENATLVGEQITLIAQQHGVIVSDAVITPWLNGETAIAGYGETLSAQSSVFIGNLIGVENEVIELQNKANVTSVALSNMFATRADNLVGQLRASWYEEDNLNYATNLLHQNLIDTLQGSYDVSGIVGSLNAIKAAADAAADALDRALSSGGDSSKTYYHMGSDGKGWYIKDLYGSYKKYYGSFEEASNELDKLKKKNYNYKGYAKGSKRIPEDQLAWTDEHGEREMIIRRSDGAILTRLERGDAIANANLAENLFKWGEINPNRFMQGLGSNTTVSKINVPMRESKPNITLDYDLNIGSFTDGEHLLNTIQKVSKDSATKLLNDINRDFRIHSR